MSGLKYLLERVESEPHLSARIGFRLIKCKEYEVVCYEITLLFNTCSRGNTMRFASSSACSSFVSQSTMTPVTHCSDV